MPRDTKQYTLRLDTSMIASLELEMQRRNVSNIQQVIYEILNERYSNKKIEKKELIDICNFLNEYLSYLRIFDPDSVTLKQASNVSIDESVVKVSSVASLNKKEMS